MIQYLIVPTRLTLSQHLFLQEVHLLIYFQSNCFQVKYLLLLTEVGISAPTKADFEAADLDANGALLFKEWKDWAAEQI